MSKKKKKSVLKKSKPKVKKSPRQEALPGLEDRGIKAIDTAAADYNDVKTQRIALLADEVSLKQELLTLMKRYKKSHYKHGTIEIDIKPEGEKIIVKIKDENEEKPDDTQPEEEKTEETDDYLADAVPEQTEESEAQPD